MYGEETIEDLQERMGRLIALQKQFPQCNNIAKEINRVQDRIKEMKENEENLTIL